MTTRDLPTAPRTVTARSAAPSFVRSFHPWTALAGLALLTAAALALFACSGGDSRGGAEGGAGSATSAPNADFRLASLEGGQVSPRDFEGQVVLVDFWATWCGPCHAQAEILEQVYGEIQGDGVRFLAVNLGEDLDTVKQFVAKSPFPYPVLLDPEDHLTYDFGIYGLPTLMVVDTRGKVSYFHTGLVGRSDVMAELRRAGASVG